MPIEETRIMHALVVLRPPGGKPLPANAQITVENLPEFKPSEKDARAAIAFFENVGFKTTALAGISFDISGSVHLFETFFNTALLEDENGVISSRAEGATAGYELPRQALSSELETIIEAVTLSPPPDFGPGGAFL